MPKITEAGKRREKRGTGTEGGYRPYIKARELNSTGTAESLRDYKTGRVVELLSQGEVWYWYLLRWRDDVADIREQYPLRLTDTLRLARELGIRHPDDGRRPMTTDLYVTLTDASHEAYSVKAGRKSLNNPRTVEKLYLEKLYWQARGVPFHLVFKEDVSRVLIRNIMDVTACYDEADVHDRASLIRHRIARKELKADLSRGPLDIEMLIREEHLHGRMDGPVGEDHPAE